MGLKWIDHSGQTPSLWHEVTCFNSSVVVIKNRLNSASRYRGPRGAFVLGASIMGFFSGIGERFEHCYKTPNDDTIPASQDVLGHLWFFIIVCYSPE